MICDCVVGSVADALVCVSVPVLCLSVSDAYLIPYSDSFVNLETSDINSRRTVLYVIDIHKLLYTPLLVIFFVFPQVYSNSPAALTISGSSPDLLSA